MYFSQVLQFVSARSLGGKRGTRHALSPRGNLVYMHTHSKHTCTFILITYDDGLVVRGGWITDKGQQRRLGIMRGWLINTACDSSPASVLYISDALQTVLFWGNASLQDDATPSMLHCRHRVVDACSIRCPPNVEPCVKAKMVHHGITRHQDIVSPSPFAPPTFKQDITVQSSPSIHEVQEWSFSRCGRLVNRSRHRTCEFLTNNLPTVQLFFPPPLEYDGIFSWHLTPI